MLDHFPLAQKAEDGLLVVYDQRGGRVDLVALPQLGKEREVNDIGGDMPIENRELVRQPGHMAADGSGWRHKHLQMHGAPQQA